MVLKKTELPLNKENSDINKYIQKEFLFFFLLYFTDELVWLFKNRRLVWKCLGRQTIYEKNDNNS